jgi:ketosteroid isomerase-like protein
MLVCVAIPSAAYCTTPTNNSETCAAANHHEFDFWIGDWEAFDFDNPDKIVARTRVTSILGGCVLFEEYNGASGLEGLSLSILDASKPQWHQSWVTNRGQLLLLDGKMESGAMVLSGMELVSGGKKRQVRGTWKRVNGGVRESAETSLDHGKSWQPWFDLVFRPVAAGEGSAKPSAADDQKTVAALDTEYQAAVEKNDPATMARILADDFVLVTSSGKTYKKADLLQEARSGKTSYEYQDDSEQTVRVWGDTAVVTAKLRAKGIDDGKPFEYSLWFSDTYIRRSEGWRYVFGQASSRLPKQHGGGGS